MSGMNYSEALRSFLASNRIWHRFIEFNEPVKTVDQAGRKVPVEKIAKSIVLIDSEGQPILAILPATRKISYRKVKKLVQVKNVRLATEEEVLKFSGYPAGGVPPFNNVKRALLDLEVLKNETSIVGGGDIDKLVEVKTNDIVNHIKPAISDLSREESFPA